jgi:hypothetical protein
VAGCCESGNEPWDSINGEEFLTNYTAVTLSRRALLHGVTLCCYVHTKVYPKVSGLSR